MLMQMIFFSYIESIANNFVKCVDVVSLSNVSIAYQIHLTMSIIVAYLKINFLKFKLFKNFASTKM